MASYNIDSKLADRLFAAAIKEEQADVCQRLAQQSLGTLRPELRYPDSSLSVSPLLSLDKRAIISPVYARAGLTLSVEVTSAIERFTREFQTNLELDERQFVANAICESLGYLANRKPDSQAIQHCLGRVSQAIKTFNLEPTDDEDRGNFSLLRASAMFELAREVFSRPELLELIGNKVCYQSGGLLLEGVESSADHKFARVKFNSTVREAERREKIFLEHLVNTFGLDKAEVEKVYRFVAEHAANVPARAPIITHLPFESSDLNAFVQSMIPEITEGKNLPYTIRTYSCGLWTIRTNDRFRLFVHDWYVLQAEDQGSMDALISVPRVCLETPVFEALIKEESGHRFLNHLRGLVALMDHDYLHHLHLLFVRDRFAPDEICAPGSKFLGHVLPNAAQFAEKQKEILERFGGDSEQLAIYSHRAVLQSFDASLGGKIFQALKRHFVDAAQQLKELKDSGTLTSGDVEYALGAFCFFLSDIFTVTEKHKQQLNAGVLKANSSQEVETAVHQVWDALVQEMNSEPVLERARKLKACEDYLKLSLQRAGELMPDAIRSN